MKPDKLLVALGAIIIAITIIALCFQIHWAVGSIIAGFIIMIAGCIWPEDK